MEGYKKKPVLIEVFALLYLLNPIGNLLFVWFLNSQYSFTEVMGMLLELLKRGNVIFILMLIFWLSAIPLSIGLYRVRLWAWYYFIIHSTGMFVLSMFGSGHFRISYATIVNLLFLLPIGYFISKEIRVPYFNPRMRWWEQSTRFLHDVKLKISGKVCTTYDFSENGAFISDDNAGSLSIGETVPAEIDLEKTIINCFADIRWINLKKSRYPVGYGIKFEKINPKDRTTLRNYIQRIIRTGKEESR